MFLWLEWRDKKEIMKQENLQENQLPEMMFLQPAAFMKVNSRIICVTNNFKKYNSLKKNTA